MKHCTYCGKEYTDDISNCPIDGKPLQPDGLPTSDPHPPPVPSRNTISNEERRFWEQMTFKQFAVLMIQLQAIWLLFNAVIDVTYLPRYFRGTDSLSAFTPLYRQLGFD